MITFIGILTIFGNPEVPIYKKMVSAPFQHVKLSQKLNLSGANGFCGQLRFVGSEKARSRMQ